MRFGQITTEVVTLNGEASFRAMNYESKIHPLNAKGRYYVDVNTCTCDELCVYIAPNNFKYDEENCGYYVIKQPETVKEEEKCREAMQCWAVEAIHNGEK